MQVRVGCEFVFESDAPAPQVMLVRARPAQDQQVLYESRWIEPEVPLHEYVDAFGNFCWRLTVPGGLLTVRYDAALDVERVPDPVALDTPVRLVQDLPDETLVFTLPSRFAESDLLVDAAWRLFGETPPTWARVQAICDWIHQNVRYAPGSSGPSSTALDVFRTQQGVCRDFALIAVALCRAMNIPARYACGYLPDIDVEPPDTPMDFHAWFEAYLGDQWYTFDARHNVPRVGRVLIGRGRDAADVALTTSYGATRLHQLTVWADEIKAGGGRDLPQEDADSLEAADDERTKPADVPARRLEPGSAHA